MLSSSEHKVYILKIEPDPFRRFIYTIQISFSFFILFNGNDDFIVEFIKSISPLPVASFLMKAVFDYKRTNGQARDIFCSVGC